MLFILTLGILIVVLIKGNNLRMKETCIPEIQNQDNQTVKQLRDQLLENNATIEQLNKTLVEIQQRRSRINIGT